jgi:hypothetical protein
VLKKAQADSEARVLDLRDETPVVKPGSPA